MVSVEAIYRLDEFSTQFILNSFIDWNGNCVKWILKDSCSLLYGVEYCIKPIYHSHECIPLHTCSHTCSLINSLENWVKVLVKLSAHWKYNSLNCLAIVSFLSRHIRNSKYATEWLQCSEWRIKWHTAFNSNCKVYVERRSLTVCGGWCHPFLLFCRLCLHFGQLNGQFEITA